MRPGTTIRTMVALWAALLLTTALPIAAVEPDAVLPTPAPGFPARATHAFGPHTQATAFHAIAFAPVWTASFTPVLAPHATGGYFGPADPGNGQAYRVQVTLPNGAAIDSIEAPVIDDDIDGRVVVEFSGSESAPPGGAGHDVSFGSADTGLLDLPGYTSLNLSFDPPVMFASVADLDADGNANPVSFTLTFVIDLTDPNAESFWGAVVHWHRTISPAPATATFADVPTGHWAFSFVEALASSGITAGCGGGNYCPDNPITRAEMAVYLAAALGLHWPQ